MNSTLYNIDMRNLIYDPSMAACADLVFADPPYNIGQSYGSTFNDSMTDSAFRVFIDQFIRAIDHIAKPNATFWTMMSEKHTDCLGEALRIFGITRRRIVVWHETFGVYQQNNFSESCRFLHYCVMNPKKFTFNADAIRVPSDRQTKYKDSRANPLGRIPSNLFTDSRICGTFKERVKTGVPNQLPESLIARIIHLCSNEGDFVFDPFSGTGTTGKVCRDLNRNFIGCEINPHYAKAAASRMKAELL